MDSGAPVIEQMTLDLSWEDHVPGDCEHEQAVADIGGGKFINVDYCIINLQAHLTRQQGSNGSMHKHGGL